MANDNLQNAIATTSAAPVAAAGAAQAANQGINPKLREALGMARRFAASTLVPKHLQGREDDCFIALVMADQLGENPLMVMQNIVIVSGTAGWKATFVIARANRLGPFTGPIEFRTEGKGPTLSVTAYATVKVTGRTVEKRVDMAMAEAAKWTSNPKYKEIPEQMLSYRAACFLVRLYCPEVLLGMQSEDELVDVRASRGGYEGDPGPVNSGAIAAINATIVVEKPAENVSDEPSDDEMRKAGAQ
jgi:hypothetical protein